MKFVINFCPRNLWARVATRWRTSLHQVSLGCFPLGEFPRFQGPAVGSTFSRVLESTCPTIHRGTDLEASCFQNTSRLWCRACRSSTANSAAHAIRYATVGCLVSIFRPFDLVLVSMGWLLFLSCAHQHTIVTFDWVHCEFHENWKAMMLGKPVPSTQNGLNKKCSLNLIAFGAGFLMMVSITVIARNAIPYTLSSEANEVSRRSRLAILNPLRMLNSIPR